MSAKIVRLKPPNPASKPAFQKPAKPPPPREYLVRKVRELLAESSLNMKYDHKHFRERQDQRGVTMRQMLETLKSGSCVSGPTLDDYGDWRIKFKRVVAGRRVQVVVAIKENHFIVVTVI